MNSRDKEKSLLEIAVALLQRKRKPQKINDIIKEVMSIKGIKPSEIEQYIPQFLLDFMKSGYFIYCGNDCWDLKERQKVSVNDKDSEYGIYDNDEAAENELGNEKNNLPVYKNQSDIDDPEDDNENDDDSDDLSREFDDLEEDSSAELTEVENEIEIDVDEEDEEEEKDDEFDFE